MSQGIMYKPRYGKRPFLWSTVEPLIMGMNDFLSGRKFPMEYDGWDKMKQANYENGRLQAANITKAGLKLTIPSNQQAYTRYRAQRKLAAEKIGDASPGVVKC